MRDVPFQGGIDMPHLGKMPRNRTAILFFILFPDQGNLVQL
jgi:hypothetical protein